MGVSRKNDSFQKPQCSSYIILWSGVPQLSEISKRAHPERAIAGVGVLVYLLLNIV